METTTQTPVVKTPDTLSDELFVTVGYKAQYIDSEIEKINSEIEKLTRVKHMTQERATAFNMKIPALSIALEKMGLGISKITFSKTGLSDERWEDGDKLIFHIDAKPISGKFCFIKFNGYTSRGSGKNKERLQTKSNKIEEILSEAIGVRSIDVNSYSLEVRNEGDSKTVFIQIWI